MRILVLQFRRLGDMLMTTPMARAIRAARPDAVVDVAVEPSSLPAIQFNPNIDATIVSPGGPSLRLVPCLRRARYDVVIDTLGSPRSARLAWMTSAPCRIGLAKRWRRWGYTHAVTPSPEPRYSALEKLALLEPLGIHETDCRIELFPTEIEREEAARFWSSLEIPRDRTVVAFSPVSRRSPKIWPAERFAEMCDRWAERAGLTYVPLFGPGEEPLVEAVTSRARRRDAFCYPCPPVSFGALVPLLERCAFYFGHDNGIRHVAIAAGIPTAAIFGPPDPLSWTPPGSTRDFHVGGGAPAAAVSIEAVDAMLARVVGSLGSAPSRIH